MGKTAVTSATPEARLKAGALGFPALLMQGVTHIAPAVGLLLTIQVITFWAGCASVFPLPRGPIRFAPWLVGGWLGLGVLLLIVLNRARREDWLLKAGSTAHE